MAKRYKKLIITKDTIVPLGAMQVESVFKDDGHFSKSEELKVEELLKFDDNNQCMYNVMVVFGKEDSQGMILDDIEVRDEALKSFMVDGDKVLKFTHEKDEDGESFDIDADVLGIYPVQKGDPIFPDYVDSIARVAKFNDPEEYELVKTMGWQSSIEGKCVLLDFLLWHSIFNDFFKVIAFEYFQHFFFKIHFILLFGFWIIFFLDFESHFFLYVFNELVKVSNH